MKRFIYILGVLLVLVVVSGCNKNNSGLNTDSTNHDATETSLTEEGSSEKAGSEKVINVGIINTEGNETGQATLTQEENGVLIEIEAWDLPKGTHGFHIHEKGVCEKPDFKSAGEHFNPTDKKHGFDNPDGPHAGDLPNLEVGEDGKVSESYLNEMVTLKPGEDNTLVREGGTSLVIHADPDDNISQPAGNAGDRIACGVIKE